MIIVAGKIIKRETFGDGTLKVNELKIGDDQVINITWCYDDDGELFLLWNIAKYIQEEYPDKQVTLTLPYIPNARQDRKVSNRLFTLKYFAQLINSMAFKKVYVLDPHSDVSTALIDRVEELPLPFGVQLPKGAAYMFPDAGAAKKYSQRYKLDPDDKPFIIGNKCRDADGRITSYELLNFVEGTKEVIIRDDICSFGGTFVAAAEELRKRGVEKISLVISHCENNITKGKTFAFVDKVYTTDSICTTSHPQLVVTKAYRQGE